jgi:YcaO-like protein with predicted kinase domain
VRLKQAMKMTDDGAHRVAPLHQTYHHIWPLLRRTGMTEHDLTDYHGVAIPVWSVQQQHDVSHQRTAYGKGVSHIQSRVSAMMEAIERYSAEQLPRTIQCASYRQMCQQKACTIIPQQITQGVDATWSEDVVIEWLPGTDLNTHEEVWVPASCVLLHPEPLGPRFIPVRTSNGLASGNTLEEAICHSLYEMIERDAWSLAWLRAVTIPHIRRIAPLIVQHPGTVTWSDSDQ